MQTMSRAPAAVLWDMDGTLVDTEPYWMEAERDLVESYGGEWPEHHARAVVGFDLIDSAHYIREHGGVPLEPEEIVESDGVDEALIKVADSYIQLTAATREDSPIAKSIEKRGEGLHHVGYRVDDCAAALAAMVAAGATAIDQEPRPGSRGTTVAFVHPKGSFGTLIELVQE